MPTRIGGVTYYRIREVARLFRVDTNTTVHRWITAGLIESEFVSGRGRLFRESVLRRHLRLRENEEMELAWLTTNELHQLFRVDITTAARWCDEGLFGAVRTPGGDHLANERLVRVYIGQPYGDLFDDPFMTASETSHRLGRSKETVNLWGRTGKLESIRTPSGRSRLFRTSSVEALLRTMRLLRATRGE